MSVAYKIINDGDIKVVFVRGAVEVTLTTTEVKSILQEMLAVDTSENSFSWMGLNYVAVPELEFPDSPCKGCAFNSDAFIGEACYVERRPSCDGEIRKDERGIIWKLEI